MQVGNLLHKWNVGNDQQGGNYRTLCSEKNTHSPFVSYLHELFVDLNKNCSEYTQGLIDSDNVKIRYSLWSMT